MPLRGVRAVLLQPEQCHLERPHTAQQTGRRTAEFHRWPAFEVGPSAELRRRRHPSESPPFCCCRLSTLRPHPKTDPHGNPPVAQYARDVVRFGCTRRHGIAVAKVLFASLDRVPFAQQESRHDGNV